MRDGLNLGLGDPEWVGLLRAERDGGKSVSQIARECGIARSSVSMLIAGTYPAQSLDLATRKHGARVVALYRDAILCPHLRRGIPAEECRRQASAPMSTSNPDRLRQWSACRRCDLNPLTLTQEDPKS
ncbi:hypothetical protein RGUI_2739 [Rhodovulum sp. P5]|uniref:hypothetical protein n=1 Tax=Rhodovulum sp. P5 TaxID=1564506 RepID=UPI0009C31147|nr:hypothetical protein [Rhodovulum sp. P5]ARE40880.1 hypothetical protein RGUI_2739 [Rhodovulum sp. P5]